jgi:hypothetical protein
MTGDLATEARRHTPNPQSECWAVRQPMDTNGTHLLRSSYFPTLTT